MTAAFTTWLFTALIVVLELLHAHNADDHGALAHEPPHPRTHAPLHCEPIPRSPDKDSHVFFPTGVWDVSATRSSARPTLSPAPASDIRSRGNPRPQLSAHTEPTEFFTLALHRDTSCDAPAAPHGSSTVTTARTASDLIPTVPFPGDSPSSRAHDRSLTTAPVTSVGLSAALTPLLRP